MKWGEWKDMKRADERGGLWKDTAWKKYDGTTDADWNQPSEIMPNLWVGNIDNCPKFDGVCLNVLEYQSCNNPLCVNIPLIRPETETTATAEALNELADVAIEMMKRTPLMIHCAVGMERSPLTAMWVVARLKKISLQQALVFVQSKRRIAADRLYWLTEPRFQWPASYSAGGLYDYDSGHWEKDGKNWNWVIGEEVVAISPARVGTCDNCGSASLEGMSCKGPKGEWGKHWVGSGFNEMDK